MLGQPFTHDLIRKYVVSVGTLFNNIKLQRKDSTGTTVQWISVPLTYGPKEKWAQRLSDPNLTQQVQVTLPRLSYELVTMNYAPERKGNTLNKHKMLTTGNDNTLTTMFQPVPYDFQFALHLYVRNAADGTNIVEQILPFFTPEFTVTINNATGHNIDIDFPVIIDGITKDDAYEGDFQSSRTIIWTLDFTAKGLLYGPTQNSKIIKRAYVDFFIPDSFVEFHKGQLATNSVDNSTLFLQTNTSSRDSNTYLGGTITITGEGSGTTGITGNTRTISSHDGDKQTIGVSTPFLDLPTDSWTYTIQYRGDRKSKIGTDQLTGIPTATRIYTVPGLTVDGDPTSNAQISVSENIIDGEDDYGIIQTKTFFPSNTALAGTRRNLITGIDEDV